MIEVGFEDVTLQHQVCEFALSHDLDKPRGLQFFHVMGKRGRAYGVAPAHIGAGGTRTLRTDLLQDLMAARIGQSLRDQAYLPR